MLLSQPMGSGEQRAPEGNSGKWQLSWLGGAPVPKDSESVDLGIGAGRSGEAGFSPKNLSQGQPRL